MKKECEIVQDLLFGYNDGVISKSSTELVENHLKECDICKNKLEEIQKDSKDDNQKKEVDYLKKVKNKLKRRKKIIITVLSILFIIIVFNVALFINYNLTPSEVQVYLLDDITEEQKDDIENTLKGFGNITYESKEEALNRIREKLGENAYIINGWDEDNPFRASFTVKVDSEDIEKITSLVENLDGVHSVEFMHIGNPYELFIINILMNKS